MNDQAQDDGSDDLPQTTGKIADYVHGLVILKAKRKALKDAFEKEDKPMAEEEDEFSTYILGLLRNAGLENARTAYGTVFPITRVTASLADPDLFMKHVIETGQFELLDRKANTTAVRDYVGQHKQLPPGTNLNSRMTLGLHKKVLAKT